MFTYHQISACNNIVGDSIYRITDMSIRVETFESEIGEVHDAMKLLTGMLNDVQRNLKVFSSHHDNNNVGQEGFRDLEGRMEKLERFCDSSGSQLTHIKHIYSDNTFILTCVTFRQMKGSKHFRNIVDIISYLKNISSTIKYHGKAIMDADQQVSNAWCIYVLSYEEYGISSLVCLYVCIFLCLFLPSLQHTQVRVLMERY